MILSEVDTLWAANEFIDYFERFNTIEDYIRFTKEAAVKERGQSIVSLKDEFFNDCLLYTSPSPRDRTRSRMPSSA